MSSGISQKNNTNDNDSAIVELEGADSGGVYRKLNTFLRSDGLYGLPVQSELGRNQLFNFIHLSNWMRGARYDSVTQSISGTIMTLKYYEDGALLGEAFIDFSSESTWSFSISRYLDDDNGVPLDLDNDSYMLMD